MKIHRFFTTVIYIRSKCQNISLDSPWIWMSFLGFILFQIEREREVNKIWVERKNVPKLLILFSTGLHWRIFLLSRAKRLCSVFSTGLKDFGVPRVSVNLLSLARSKMAMVRLPRALLKKLPFFLFTSAEGKGTPLPFGVPANHLASLSFPFRCPATWGHLSANIWSPVWPTFLPNGHFLTAWYSHSIREDSISLTSSSPWAITWQIFLGFWFYSTLYLRWLRHYLCLLLL